jgi:hypothetical protein
MANCIPQAHSSNMHACVCNRWDSSEPMLPLMHANAGQLLHMQNNPHSKYHMHEKQHMHVAALTTPTC